MIKYLTLEEILYLHFQLIIDFGGAQGLREESRIHSIVVAPQQVVFGQEQYPTLYEKASIYLRNLVADHPFVDGNKRIAVTCMGIFLIRNGVRLTASPQRLEQLVIDVILTHMSIAEIAEWLRAHTLPL